MKRLTALFIVLVLALCVGARTLGDYQQSGMRYIAPSEYLNVHLLNGSTSDMSVNGSVTPAVYGYTIPEGKVVVIARLLFVMETVSNIASITEFGDISGGLGTGVVIDINGTELTTLDSNLEIICNQYDVQNPGKLWASDQKNMQGRWTFSKAASGTAGILLTEGQTFSATINDDLSSLVAYEMRIQGVVFDK